MYIFNSFTTLIRVFRQNRLTCETSLFYAPHTPTHKHYYTLTLKNLCTV